MQRNGIGFDFNFGAFGIPLHPVVFIKAYYIPQQWIFISKAESLIT
jgi:hypothetical protein